MKTRIFALLLLTATSQLSLAGDMEGYLGIGIGDSMASFSSSGSSSSNTKSAVAARVIGGFAFSKHIAIEAEYADLGTFHDVSFALTEMHNTATSIALKGAFTFPRGFSFYGKVGASKVTTDYTVMPGWSVTMPIKQTKNGVSIGWGGEWAYSDHGSLRVSLDSYEVGTEGITGRVGMFGVTALVRF